MATNDEGPGKGSVKGATDQTGPRKPAAILDLKPTSVGVEDPPKKSPEASPAVPGSTAASKPEEKPSEKKPEGQAKPDAQKPAAAPGAGSVPSFGVNAPPSSAPASASTGAGTSAAASAPPGGASKPADTKPSDKSGSKPTVASASSTSPSNTQSTAPASAKAKEPANASSNAMSALTHLAAGLAGGLLVLFAADAVGPQLGLDLRRSETAQTRELESRIAAIETSARTPAPSAVPTEVDRRLAGVEKRAADVDTLRQRLGELEQRNAALSAEANALEERLGAKPSESTDNRVARLEDILGTIQRAAGEQGGRVPQLAAITGRLADLEATLNTQLAQLRKSLTQDVDARLTGANEASEAARTGTARIDRELATQKSDAARVGQRLDRVELGVRSAEETASGLRSAIDSLRSEIGQQMKSVARPADVASAVNPLTGRVAGIEQSLQSVEKSEAERRASVERIVLSLELGNLKRAVERGTPFSAELAQVRGLAKVDLSALERYKDTGITSTANLQRDFRDLSYRIIDADRDGDNAGIVDRLIAGAKSVVRVRKTDAAAGDTGAEAIVARMDQALKEGRLSDVGAEAAKLSEPARKVAASWLDRVEASAAVDRAISSVEAELKSTLGAAGKRG